ncbi:phage tail tape measure C-terminal domain-containing protein [Paucibacter sp. R3-3]|uniref:Phage tail tape measure C-terminal domain-containing protein n=1 Tax=Roseateles agri TaxID=3098619 RepID=A0ABU5DS16_9BURK|nr:phage tail tape measure C-terminal domain-containing protein [Paucibacter sp. R3-3]MDY0748501.1 phage tail tape measure C-terminal domain-containing protein [Paucibacter sp. R3-3]
MPLAVLSIDIEARLAKLQQDLDQAGRLAEKNAQQIRASYTRVASVVAGLGGMIAGAFAGFSIVEFVKHNAEAIDALNDVKDATGSSIENISALEQVALKTGGSLEDVSTTLIKFNKVLSEGNANGPMTQTLKSIGLNAEDLKRLDPAEAVRQVAIALSRYADDGNKARLIQELFGKSTKEVAHFLHDLAEAGELNSKITTEQADQAEKFNKQLFELKTNSENSARAITSSLIPALNSLFDGYKKGGAKGAVNAFGALFGLDDAYYEIRNNIKPLQAALESAQKDYATFTEAIAKDPYNRAYQQRLQESAAGIEEYTQKLEVARAKFLKLTDGSAGAGRGSINPDNVEMRPSAPDVPAKPDAAALQEQKRYEDLNKKIRERLDLAKQELSTGEKVTEADKLRIDVESELASVKLSDAHKAAIRDILARTVATVKLTERQREAIKMTTEESRAVANYSQSLDDQNRALREQLEEIGLTALKLEELRITRLQDTLARKQEQAATLEQMGADGDLLTQMQMNIDALKEQIRLRKEVSTKTNAPIYDPYAGASKALDDYLEKSGRAGEAAGQAITSTLSSIEDGLTGVLMGTKGSAHQFVENIRAELLRLVVVKPFIDSLAASIRGLFGGGDAAQGKNVVGLFASLFGATNSSGATASDLFSSFSSANPYWAKGGAFGADGVIAKFAKGDIFNRPTAFAYGAGNLGIMGEAGPEAVMPLKRGPDGRLGVSAGQAGGKINIINQTTGRIDNVREVQMSPTERALILEEATDRAKASFTADLYDPNSAASRAMKKNFKSERNR